MTARPPSAWPFGGRCYTRRISGRPPACVVGSVPRGDRAGRTKALVEKGRREYNQSGPSGSLEHCLHASEAYDRHLCPAHPEYSGGATGGSGSLDAYALREPVQEVLMIPSRADAFYRLLTLIGRVATEAPPVGDRGNEPRQRLLRLAHLFSDPRAVLSKYPEAMGAADELQRLCGPLVYMVLNAPLSQDHHEERVFVAVLHPSITTPLERQERRVPSPDTGHACDVVFFRRRFGPYRDQGSRAQLETRWKDEWSDYSSITDEKLVHNVYTWNQFLLHGCRVPMALGLTWRWHSDRPHADRYVRLDRGLAKNLGLPMLTRRRRPWLDKLALSPRDAPRAEPGAAEKLAPLWKAMHPNPSVDVPATVTSSVYYLARSFAIWGGDGFMSVPVLLSAQEGLRAAAVLSVCTRPSLTDAELLAWQSVAVACFASAAAAELSEHEGVMGRVRALEGIGHAMKWATQLTMWESISEKLRDAVDDQTLEAAHAQSLLRRAASSLELVALAQGLGNLVRVVAALNRGLLEKLSEWYDPRGHREWEEGRAEPITAAYAELAFNVGRTVCRGTGWPTLRCEVIGEGGEIEVKWWGAAGSDESDGALHPSRLRVPPFRRGCDAVYVMIAALGEPMKNATHAMKDERVDPEEPLRIRMRPSLSEDEILIEIGNVTSSGRTELPPGVRDTEALVRDTSIVTYGDPYRDADDGDVFWVPVHVRPMKLSRMLKERRERDTGSRGDGK